MMLNKLFSILLVFTMVSSLALTTNVIASENIEVITGDINNHIILRTTPLNPITFSIPISTDLAEKVSADKSLIKADGKLKLVDVSTDPPSATFSYTPRMEGKYVKFVTIGDKKVRVDIYSYGVPKNKVGPAKQTQFVAEATITADGDSTVDPGEHFLVHYDSDPRSASYVTQERARFIATVGENAWDTEIDSYNFLQPPDDVIDVYVLLDEPGAYGVTYYGGHRIDINSDFSWLDYDRDGTSEDGEQEGAIRVTMAHEFFHTIQLSYNDWDETLWIIEGSAVWMEDQVADDVNDYAINPDYHCDINDNDNDGLYGEDPIDGFDNDQDGGIDEDPPDMVVTLHINSYVTDYLGNLDQQLLDVDDDSDSLRGEDWIDGRDNDGDGSIDEDPDTSLSYPAVLLWKIYSEHYGGVERVKKIFEETSTRNYEDAVDAGLKVVIAGLSTTFQDAFTSQREIITTLDSLGDIKYSYFTRANYLNNYEYEEGNLYPDATLYDGTHNPINFDGTTVSTGAQNVNPWAADYIKITSTAENMNITFDGDDASDFIVKVLLISNCGCFGNFEIELDNNREGSFTVKNANNYDEIVVIVSRVSMNGGGTYEITLDTPDKINPKDTIIPGLIWLCCQQNPDGSWSYYGKRSIGLTSLAVLSFLNYGIDETDPTVAKAIQWIVSHQQADGSITAGPVSREDNRVYDTSMAILALVATHNESYNDVIRRATDFLIRAQVDESEGHNINSPVYGGWGYPRSNWADLSNTQFALMALDAAAVIENGNVNSLVPKDHWVWDKAQVFLARCQNREANVDVTINGTTYTITPDYNFYDDGGFIYKPGSTGWAGGRSYGSMTAAGLWSLLLCDIDINDPRVLAALDWLDNKHYHVDQNYPIGNTWVYYYDLTLAKAFTMAEAKGWKSKHDWYKDLSEFLLSKQAEDGHWPNIEGYESCDILTTVEAILALEVREIPGEIQRLSWITFILHSNADLHVYDPLGRHIGINYQTGEIENQIPNATIVYTETEQMITVPQLESGDYRVVLVGTGDGEYELTIRAGVGNETVKEESYRRTISKGETHEAKVGVAMIAGLTITIEEPETPTNYVIQTATRRGNATFIPDKGEIEGLRAINESDLPEEGKPALQFPFGFFSFNITGLNPNQTVNITIAFPQNIPTTAQYWKYGPNGSIDNPQPERWYQIPMGSNDGDNIITITLQDGGIGDDDGVANGVIVDQGGPGIPTVVARVPTLTPIGITALAGLLLIIGISRIKKRK